MKAAYFTELGGPGVIRHGDQPLPGPEAGTVLVRVAASAVNHVDTFVRSGAYATELRFPQVVGRDLVGTAELIGPGAAGRFSPGDAVWSNSMGFGGRPGAAAQFIAVPADRLYRLPPGVDPVQAAAVLHSGATSHLALHRHGRMSSGHTVFVGGAGGGVGSAAVAMAAQAGARVICSSSRADAGHCLALGADVALDYRSPTFAADLRDAVQAVSGGRGLDIHLETSGRHLLELAVDLLGRGGRIIAMSGISGTDPVPLGKLYTRDGSILGFAISNATVAELADAASAVNALLAGGFRARGVSPRPLAGAAAAHEALAAGTVHGKIVLVP
ncbi:oxidoreductase [Arthrobacter stackebrandtii]|nr:oxidoreductase [Arthrobacter stackebrandtii]